MFFHLDLFIYVRFFVCLFVCWSSRNQNVEMLMIFQTTIMCSMMQLTRPHGIHSGPARDSHETRVEHASCVAHTDLL